MEESQETSQKTRQYGSTIANVIILIILLIAGFYSFVFIFERRIVADQQNIIDTKGVNFFNELNEEGSESRLLLETENENITEEDINELIEEIIKDDKITTEEVKSLAEDIGI